MNTMNTYKAVINFARRTSPEIRVTATFIHDSMSANAGIFDDPPFAMAEFMARITDFTAKMLARASNATVDVVAARQSRTEMLATLRQLGNYVNSKAQGSLEVLILSGFPHYDTRRARAREPFAPPDPPYALVLRHGPVSGMILLRFKAALPAAASLVQVSLEGPQKEAAWQDRGVCCSHRFTLSGFPPGVLVHVRVRTIGRGGTLSDPSQAVEIRTL